MQGENTHILGNSQNTFLLRSSTVEVAHFRYFVSERRGCLTPNRWDVNNLDFEQKKCFVDSGHGVIRRDTF